MARQARYTQTLGPTKLTPDQDAKLDEEAEERGVSLAEVVRDALDARYGLVAGKVPASA